MKTEEDKILDKMDRLFKMHRLLKEKKLRRIKDKTLKYGRYDPDEEDEDYEDDLLSRPELIEEALKEYMYQFGLSIYQNKQGDYYFKQFVDEDIRGFDELDSHHFSLREREPNFFEKLLETVPESRIQLNGDMETAVMDLYDKDAVMSDILNQMVNDEITKCQEIIRAQEETYAAERGFLQNEFVRTAEENTATGQGQTVSGREEDLHKTGDSGTTDGETGTPAAEQWESYQCGEERVEKTPVRKPLKVRRVRRQTKLPAGMVKDNSNNR